MLSAFLRHLRPLAADALRAGAALPVGLLAVFRAKPGAGRAVVRIVVGLPLDLAAFVLCAYAAFNTVRNVGYPLWYLDTDYHQAWGGPTMAGVWAVHALGWAACLYVLARWPMRWIRRGQLRLDRAPFGRAVVTVDQAGEAGRPGAGVGRS
ncbi:hypothetical protein ACIA8O_15820 [Kitasatospora sp. NPDC051853]|uniref:hypothetical protein n=1 Tax=Kitasatospora sp. NPDC051853 TaxID=3364058 RepID=UPI0037941C00